MNRALRSFALHIANLVSPLLPQTRGFALRRWLYRRAGLHIGANVRINGGVVIQYPNVTIGENSWIGWRSSFASTVGASITIGKDCDISQDVLIIVGSHAIGTSDRRAGTGMSRPIVIGDGTWIGARATILGGSELGRGTVVGAGSLVKGIYPDNVVIVGTPARVVRQLDDTGNVGDDV